MPSPALRFSVCLLLSSVAEAHSLTHARRAIGAASVRHTGRDTAAPAAALDGNPVSRRLLLCGAVWTTGVYSSVGSAACASAYTVSQVKPSEKETYEVAQKGDGALLKSPRSRADCLLTAPLNSSQPFGKPQREK